MISAEPYLKTQRVAQALGVSVSTIKRWVDSGTIQAARTAGKHRLIPFSEALRLAREQGFPEANLQQLAGLGPERPVVGPDGPVPVLEALLREARAAEAKTFLQSLHQSGYSAIELADDVVRPVMERIGHGWMVGSLDVYQEHEATRILTLALAELINRVARDGKAGPLAVGATPEGDPYALAGMLGELVLLESGWRVSNLGVGLPLRSLANAALCLRPRLIFLSASYVTNQDEFVKEYRSFHETVAAIGTAVILGGQALGPGIRSRLVFASYGDRMAHLAEFARRLSPPEASPTAGGSGT